MRGQRFRALLEDIQSALSIGGGTAQAKALGQLSDALKGHENTDITEITNSLNDCLDDAFGAPWVKHAKALKAAELNEQLFQQALFQVSNDKSLKKADIASLAKDYGVRADAKTSGAKLIEQIKGLFYERLYQKDADAMARRATPW